MTVKHRCVNFAITIFFKNLEFENCVLKKYLKYGVLNKYLKYCVLNKYLKYGVPNMLPCNY